MCIMQLCWCGEALGQSCVIVNCVETVVWSAECFPEHNLVKCASKKQVVPKKQGKTKSSQKGHVMCLI
jgi:hypothetical protein